MMNIDEDALICDLAETYHVLDYRSLPVQLVATLSAGLRDDSRIKLKIAEMPVDFETIILASIADNLSLLREGLREKPGKPFLFTDAIYNETKPKVKGFRTAEDFEAALRRIKGE